MVNCEMKNQLANEYDLGMPLDFTVFLWKGFFSLISYSFFLFFAGLCPALCVPHAESTQGGARRAGGNVLHCQKQLPELQRVLAVSDK
jgi:hypothetical protein